MLGAIAGDIVGSIYETAPIKTKEFPFFGPGACFTDDTVCTVAIGEAVLAGGGFADHLRRWVRTYPGAGYGDMFRRWAFDDAMGPYGSWGNGSAMRVSAVGHAARTLEGALALAARSAVVTHDHPEAVLGAQAVAAAIRFGRAGRPLDALGPFVRERFGYVVDETVTEIRARYAFDVSCRGTVPPAIVCVIEADGFEDAIRNAVSLGGDSDTLAAIAGGIAEAFFPIPDWIIDGVREHLDTRLWDAVIRFRMAHPVSVTCRAIQGRSE